MSKPTKWHVRPAKTQISLGIRPVWSEPSLCVLWVAKGPAFLHADSEDADQTGRMPRLIWVFAGRTATLLVLSWGGSYMQRTHIYLTSIVWYYETISIVGCHGFCNFLKTLNLHILNVCTTRLSYGSFATISAALKLKRIRFMSLDVTYL